MVLDWLEDGALAATSLPKSANDIRNLHERGIRAIVTLTELPLTAQLGVTWELLLDLDIKTLHLPVDDFHAPDEAQVWEAVAFIDRMQAEGRPVVIHCYAGQGRTGTFLHGYYLAKGCSLTEAKARVTACRPLCDFGDLSVEQQAFLYDFAQSDRIVYM